MFENVSIASLMNRLFINIKVDREEHPELDEIYMVARQLMTHEGGWPNNVFLTPDLKPFYAGGTYAPDESHNRPAFPRLLEWLNYSWSTQEEEVRKQAENIVSAMRPHLIHQPSTERQEVDIDVLADELFASLQGYHDARAGGFFQAPKFPHECYLNFLSGYYEHTDNPAALNMLAKTLGRMASGGIYDHVGCGFHRYAVDKEWYVPHFEKMLYNQALLARNYTDAARFTGNEYLADIAKSVLDFVSGPFTDGNGAFYAAIDAETDQIEGAYYAWTSQQIEEVLTPEEAHFFVSVFALADIPAFPGHKHTDGQVIVARKPLDEMALQLDMPYPQLAAMTAEIMNKLLAERNKRKAPGLDDKIIVSWNGLMIDAYANAGKVFGIERYVKIARRAAEYLLEHAINNDGELCRIVTGGRAQFVATLEDYACLIKGLLSVYEATEDEAMLDATISLSDRADELFSDKVPGYYGTVENDYLLLRIKSAEDSSLPSANALMVENWARLFAFTKGDVHRKKAQTTLDFFLSGNTKITVESASILQSALKFLSVTEGKAPRNVIFEARELPLQKDGLVKIAAELLPSEQGAEGNYELVTTLKIQDGWHINANQVAQRELIPTQIDVQGTGVELIDVLYPEAPDNIYEGIVTITALLKVPENDKKRPTLRLAVRFQPCDGSTCHKLQDELLTI